MTRGQRRTPSQVLSVGEIQNIRDEKRELENTLKDQQGYGEGTGRRVDESAINTQIKRYDAALQKATPPKMSGSERDRMAARAKELEDKFQDGMPTRYEMNHPARCPGAVKKHMAWLGRHENTGEVDEYRQIQRILNPGEELSVERLRKDK